MAATSASLQQAAPESVPSLLQKLDEQRTVLQQHFAEAHPTAKRKRLTREEVEQTRECIREGIEENPEYTDREAAQTLAIDQDGRVQGFLCDGVIYLDPDQMRLDTPIHEYTHLWDRLCQQKHPALWKEGVALMKQTRLWKAVKESPFYADIAKNDDLVASEVHARLAGMQGAELLKVANNKKTLADRLKNWGRRFWMFVRGNVEREQGSLSLEAFVKAPISDLISQKELVREERAASISPINRGR